MTNSIDILKEYWGYDGFRSLQQEIISALMEGNDVLTLLPTGGGKSICFQIPALSSPGICIVVTPLISLMKDQVFQLKQRGIKAVAIYSGMSKKEIDVTLDNCAYGEFKFLYVSPERLQTELFQERLKKMNVNYLVVDEAHCVSQWGYDFRPQYLNIAKFRELIPEINMIALTATATPEVKQDIIDKLELKKPETFQASFARKNLSYSIRMTEDKYVKTLEILQAIPGSAIIYVRTRKSTKDVSELLQKNNLPGDYYHGGLPHEVRSYKQDRWINGDTRVMVATNAFGMGIDKSNVRTVIHLDLPETLEAYYQEAGRAGRDGQKAYAVILSYPNDGKDLIKRIEQAHPLIETIRKVYQSLANNYKLAVGSGEGVSFDFDINRFCEVFKLENLSTYHAIKKLEEQGLIQMNESFYAPSKLMFTLDNKGLYEFMIANAQYETFIKGVLRIYGGESFGSFMNISEQKIVQHTQKSFIEVKQMLSALSDQHILDYQESKDIPQIVFTVPRQHEKNLSIDQNFLKERKETSLSKATAVSDYVANSSQCRTQQLLEYFGEKLEQRCGVCDFCVADKRKHSEDESFVKIRSAILTQLVDSPMEVDKLIKSIKNMKKERVVDVVRLMLDHGDLYYDKLGNLSVEP